MKTFRIEAKTENLDEVLAFVDEQLEAHDCGMKAQMQLDVAVEELFVNIAYYAYQPETGEATICVDFPEEDTVEIAFIDSGVPFNPLKRQDPNVHLSVEERQIGGLGIYMVKKSMDEVRYEYTDGQNRLTIRKKL